MEDKNFKYSKLKMFEEMKGNLFIEHIQNHLKEGEKVICKICNKDVDTIAEESLVKIFEDLKPLVDKLRKSANKEVGNSSHD